MILGAAWTRRLGVRRTSGVYRIPRRELVRRLAELRRAGLEPRSFPHPAPEPAGAGLDGEPGALLRFPSPRQARRVGANGR